MSFTLLTSLNKCNVYDTQLIFNFTLNEIDQANISINVELDNINKLAYEDNLNLNSSKSTLMIFGTKNCVH